MGKSGSELKDLCVDKGLKGGTSKDDRVQVLLEDAKKSGEMDKVVASMAQDARRAVLLAMDTLSLEKLCEKMKADPFVKDIMVERIIDHEVDNGIETEEPPSKK